MLTGERLAAGSVGAALMLVVISAVFAAVLAYLRWRAAGHVPEHGHNVAQCPGHHRRAQGPLRRVGRGRLHDARRDERRPAVA